MKYDAKYKTMQSAVENFYFVSKYMDNYAQRINNVKSRLGLFTSLSGYRNSLTSRYNAANELSRISIRTGQCLDNARIEYLLNEQKAYQLISGDRSFNVGDGVSPVNVPKGPGILFKSFWNVFWDFIFPPLIPLGPLVRQVIPGPTIPLWVAKYGLGILNTGIGAVSGTGWNLSFNVKDSTQPSLWEYMLGKEKFEDSFSFAQLSNGGFVLSLLTGSTSFGMESGKGKIKKWEPDDFKTYYEKNSDVDYAKSLGGVSIYGIGGKADWSLIEAKYAGEYGSVSAKLGNAEAHWSADAGMYQYDKNGNKFWSPRVAAEVGASATVLALAADGSYQFNDYLGVQGKGEVNVGKVEGKADVKAVMFDKDGKFKPEVKASASAEAIAVEAKGSAGVSVAGVEANVTGKVGVGVGAHADVGYTDGKLKVDVGAYVGVGGSVGFEVDIGGAVDAVCDGAKAVWGWASSWW